MFANESPKLVLSFSQKNAFFAQRSAALLGKIIDGDDVRVDPENIATVTKTPKPVPKTEIKSLLGLEGH